MAKVRVVEWNFPNESFWIFDQQNNVGTQFYGKFKLVIWI